MSETEKGDETLEHAGHPASDGTMSHDGHLPDGTRSHDGHLPDGTRSHDGHLPDGTRSHLGHLPDGTRSHLGHLPDGTRSHDGHLPDGTLSHAGVLARSRPPVDPAPAAPVPAPSRALGLSRAGFVEWNPGDVIDGRFDVLAVAGRGGMGIVHRVHHRLWNVDLAVKTPLPHVIANARSRDRYVAEAETWIDLGLHPNIVQCWFVTEIGGAPRLFLDYISGGSLKDWMHAGRAAPGQWDEILDLMIQACDGLAWSHARGLIHRDIKPGNLMVAPDGTLYVTDFGLVKRLPRNEPGEPPRAPTASGGGGTPAYGAPEQWLGMPVDGRADLYALGVTLFEMSTGSRPFDDPHHPEPPQQILGRHITMPPPDVRTVRADVPAPIADVIARCLKKRPADRPESAEALRAELAEIYAALPGAPRPRPVPELAAVRADGFNNRGVSLAELGKPDLALAAWDSALQVDRHHPEALFNETLIAWRHGKLRVTDAVARLEAARGSHPRVGLYLAQIHLESFNPAAAESELKRVVDLFGPDVTARRILGHAQMCQEKYEDAQATYAAAIERAPRDGEAHAALEIAREGTRSVEGRILFPRGRRMRAVTETKTGGVSALALSPVAAIAVTGGENAGVLVWDLNEGTVLNTGLGHSAAITAVAISADGKYAVSASRDETLRLWNLPGGDWIRVFEGHDDAVTSVALSPDRRTMVTGSRDRTVRVWDISEGNLRHMFAGHPGAVTSLQISPDGKLALAACDTASAMMLWDLTTGTCTKVYEGLGEGRVHLAPLPGGGTGLMRWNAGGMALYTFNTGELLHRFTGHVGEILSVTMSADGRVAISTGADDTLRAWDVAGGGAIAVLRGHDGARALGVTPDLRWAVTGSPRGMELAMWELEGDTELVRPGLTPNRARSFLETQRLSQRFNRFLGDARAAFAAGRPGEAVVSLASARALAGYERDLQALALNAELARIGLARGVANGWSEGLLDVHPKALCGVRDAGTGGAVTADGRGELAVWDLALGTRRVSVAAHEGRIGAFAVTADRQRAITCPSDECAHDPLRAYDLETGEFLLELPGHDEPVQDAYFTDDNRWLVTSAHAPPPKRRSEGLTIGEIQAAAAEAAKGPAPRENEVRVWNMRERRCERHFDGLTGRLIAVAPSGQFAVVAGLGGGALIFDLTDGRALLKLSGHYAAVTALVVLPGESRALTASADKTVRLWDLTEGACLAVSEIASAPLVALALAPGGAFAAATGDDGSVHMVAVRTATLLTSLPFARARPVNAVFVDDGRRLAIAEPGGDVHLIGLDWLLDAGASPAVAPEPAPAVDLTTAHPPARVRVKASPEEAGMPMLPTRAQVALVLCAAAALLAVYTASNAATPTLQATALAIGAALSAIAWGGYEGRPWARVGALVAVVAAALGSVWLAFSTGQVQLVRIHGVALSGSFVQVLAVIAALGCLALLDALRAPDTVEWFEWRELKGRRGSARGR